MLISGSKLLNEKTMKHFFISDDGYRTFVRKRKLRTAIVLDERRHFDVISFVYVTDV